ncbi:pentatricopeptide repeat-containing protein [Cinnamomum micranthum f. kanehirae]|uniref:Pentatricopeptide repeat-containing protein n=1 Tax=Cinnamomum micranthum f. kanehirae TaxID=337451 RepID=A0A443NQV2_9MAGN|nr:pentatricopeptide repeat-containing protein [Cinnamomum micranthum f. kanehirae]
MLFFSLQSLPSSPPTKFANTQNQIRSNTPTTYINPLPHQSDRPFLDSTTSIHLLNSCAADRDSKSTASVHAAILKCGVNTNVFVSNSLLDAYAKCGQLEASVKVFDEMPNRSVVSWTSMISAYCQNGSPDAAIYTFQQMLWEDPVLLPNEFTLAVLLRACGQKQDVKMGEMLHGYLISSGFFRDRFIQNSLVDMYSKSGALTAAEKLNDRLSCRDVVSWTSLISGHAVDEGCTEKALALFFRMQEDGVTPNVVTILSIIRACYLMNKLHILKWVHGWIVKAELCNEVLVVNSIVEMYCGNGYFIEGLKIFSQFCFRGECQYLNPETMATLVQVCAHEGLLDLGKGIHGYLIKHGFLPCIVVENSLIDMYAKSRQVNSAYQIFTKMNERDVISWNTMILCYAKNDLAQESLQLLSEIHIKERGSIVPDFVTMLGSLQACTELASLQQGEIIHGYVIRSGLGCDVFIGNSLIDMYAKAGKIDSAERIFEDMPIKDTASWNSMIAAYGMHGDGHSALRAFTKMKEYGNLQPNAITFVNVLSSCSHSGLITEGCECFNSMTTDHGLEPSMEHFACMVDLFGRSGRLREAENFIDEMPVRPSPAVWGALLGACGLFGKVDVAERVAEKLVVLEPKSKIWRVALANVYAGNGRWEDAARVRGEMKGELLRKEAGWSSVEVRGERCKFMVGDTRHPNSMNIYEALTGIREQIRDAAFPISYFSETECM